MIWKFIVLVIALVLVTAGTGNADLERGEGAWLKGYGGNEFDGRSVYNVVVSEDLKWSLGVIKWDDGQIDTDIKRVKNYPVHCTPDFQALVDGDRKDLSFTVSSVDRARILFADGKAIMELADKHDKILLRDKEDCIDGIIRFNTQGSLDLSW